MNQRKQGNETSCLSSDLMTVWGGQYQNKLPLPHHGLLQWVAQSGGGDRVGGESPGQQPPGVGFKRGFALECNIPKRSAKSIQDMLQDNYLRSADPNIQSKEAVLRKVQVSKIEDFLGSRCKGSIVDAISGRLGRPKGQASAPRADYA